VRLDHFLAETAGIGAVERARERGGV